MPTATVTLTVMVSLDVPEEHAAKVTREDLVEMAMAGCPDSSVRPGPPNGTQVVVDGVCQENESGAPVFADVFVEHDICSEPDIQFDDPGFTAAESPDAD